MSGKSVELRHGLSYGSGDWPTSAPNTVVTQHAITALHLQNSIQTGLAELDPDRRWLVTVPNGLTAAQITTAQQLAAGASGMSVETRNSVPSLA